MQLLESIYQYKFMIGSLIKRELRSHYKGSVLGFLWAFLNPLLQLVVYTMVFSIIMRAGYDKYYLFLFVALIPWIFFSTSIAGGANCIWGQKDLVNKIFFPREVLPISYVTYQLVNMLLAEIVVLAVLVASGHGLNLLALLFFPLIVIIEYVMCLGLTFIVASTTVYLRDIEHIISILMMAWQFLSPVMYGVDMVPESVRPIFMLNPMTPILTAYRDIFYYKQIPQITTLIWAVLFGVVILAVGIAVFEHLKKGFSEEL